MQILREIWRKNDCERGQKLPTLKVGIQNIWSIVMFTTDKDLCSAFLKDLRNSFTGCKWGVMSQKFDHGLIYLSFAQNMDWV